MGDRKNNNKNHKYVLRSHLKSCNTVTKTVVCSPLFYFVKVPVWDSTVCKICPMKELSKRPCPCCALLANLQLSLVPGFRDTFQLVRSIFLHRFYFLLFFPQCFKRISALMFETAASVQWFFPLLMLWLMWKNASAEKNRSPVCVRTESRSNRDCSKKTREDMQKLY